MPKRDPVQSKVKAGAVGSGIGAALAAVVVFVLGQFGVDAGEITWALAVIFAPAGSLWAGWATTERVGGATAKRNDV